MSRYIDADRVVDTLKRLRLAYSAEGQQQEAAALVAAIRIIEDAPGYTCVDVRDQQLLDAWHADMKSAVMYIKERMAERLGRYAAKRNYAAFQEVGYGDGTKIIVMRATFMVPIEPKFNPGDNSGEEGQEWTLDETS